MGERFGKAALAVLMAAAVALPGADRASAATLTVGVTPGCATIQDCIDTAVGGDTVLIPAGAYTESLTLTKAVSLVGDASTTTVVTSAGGRVLTVTGAAVDTTVTVSGLTLTGGDVSGGTSCVPSISVFTNCGGGLLLADSAQPLLADLVVSSNAAYRGGGVYAAPGSRIRATGLSLTGNSSLLAGAGAALADDVDWVGGLVFGNESTHNVGGGVAISGPDGLVVPKPVARIEGVRFESNDSGALTTLGSAHGAAIYMFHVNATIIGSDFVDNQCHATNCDGGAVYSFSSFVDTTLDIVDSTFIGNTATRGGGGVRSGSRVTSTVTDSRFETNEAGNQGGGIAAEHLSIGSSTFSGNTALGLTGSVFNQGEGGGAFIRISCSDVTDSSFVGNSAVGGGALSCGSGAMNVIGTDVMENVADEDGGGILMGTGSLSVTGGTLSGNRAGAAAAPSGGSGIPGGGGAIWARADVGISDAIVSSNTALYGGGVHVETGSLALSGGDVSDNTATDLSFFRGGGGVSVGPGDLVADATSFDRNSSASNGGAGRVGGDVQFTGVDAASNTAQNGGAFYALSNASVSGGVFSANQATGFAGGAFRVGADLDLDGAVFEANSAPFGGGAINTQTGAIAASSFTANEAGFGGAVQVSSTAEVRTSVFVGNDALTGSGGALSASFDALLVEDSNFSANTATSRGGAVSANSTIELRGVALTDNHAGTHGGGVATGGRLIADASTTINQNTAGTDGGGAWANSGATLAGTSIADNSAGGGGGGLAAFSGIVDIFGASIAGNTAVGDAGGLSAFRASLNGASVSANSAGGSGGGVWILQTAVIVESEIRGNSAAVSGGGIFRQTSNGTSLPFEIVGTTINANSAPIGDGLLIEGLRPVVMENSTISDDGLSASSADIAFRNVTIYRPGGVAVAPTSSTITATNTLVVGSCAAALVDNGGNIESPGDTCGFATASVPTAGLADPSLADNGGLTPTHALPLTSSAVDAGTSPCPATDQRGAARLDLACDVGAFEVLPVSGCTPGYWKQRHHFDSWVDLAKDDALADVFGRPLDGTLIDGLKARGGGLNALLRQGVAAALNATNPDLQPGPGVDSLAEVVTAFQAAFDSGDHEPTKDAFEATNTAGCPLS